MDDSQTEYAPDTTTKLIEFLQENLAYTFKTYFEATPTTMPTALDFPIVIVQKMEGTVGIDWTQTDLVEETMMLTFVLNRADDVGSANVRTTTMRHLQNMVEGQDPVTLVNYKAGTVLYVLRTYLTLNDWITNSSYAVSYRQVGNGKNPMLCLCDVTLRTRRHVIVNDRR